MLREGELFLTDVLPLVPAPSPASACSIFLKPTVNKYNLITTPVEKYSGRAGLPQVVVGLLLNDLQGREQPHQCHNIVEGGGEGHQHDMQRLW